MHTSCRENLTRFWSRFGEKNQDSAAPHRVLSVGDIASAADIAEVFPGVDVTIDNHNRSGLLEFPDGHFDVVVSAHDLQKTIKPSHAFAELGRVATPTGRIFVAVPSAGNYRVGETSRYSSAFLEHLAGQSSLNLLDHWTDERGPYRDVIGVFSHLDVASASASGASVELATAANTPQETWEDGNNEMSGERPYLDCLADLHEMLNPQLYLEIGVRNGRSLSLASCEAIGVDPLVDITVELPPSATLVETTSDAFFERRSGMLSVRPDLVFIDGMHLIEYVVRDFMNAERAAHDASVIVVDDVSPNHADQATRERSTRVWTGDVWKIRPVLERFRPDLTLAVLDTYPTGLLVVSDLDPTNTTLWDRYDEVLDYARNQLVTPPQRIIDRVDSVPPHGAAFKRLTDRLSGRKPPRISVIIGAFNMRRELPRTLQSLSAETQNLQVDDFEIIVVDNGSVPPVNREELAAAYPNVAVITVDDATVSPAPAINAGLARARGDFIGVLIDGARMASPGLLTQALACSQIDHRAVIGTYGFHLGDELQAAALARGYNQAVEDELLDGVDWRADGYGLFDVSVFSSSSAKGWLSTPAETNALFARREIWDELGGYDERFVSPGGGIVNHDTWLRASRLPNTQLFMLLGEGTFHQFHGGVATNSPVPKWPEFVAEYESIHGVPYEIPDIPATLFGTWRDVRLP